MFDIILQDLYVARDLLAITRYPGSRLEIAGYKLISAPLLSFQKVLLPAHRWVLY